jgi:hypothetical protein
MKNCLKTISVGCNTYPSSLYFRADEGALVGAPTWYVRLLFRLLIWCKARLSFTDVRQYAVTAPLDGDSLLQRIKVSQSDLWRIFNAKAKYLVVGRSIRHELMAEMHNRHVMFSGPITVDIGFHGRIKVCDLTVVFCDWLEGWALLPELA